MRDDKSLISFLEEHLKDASNFEDGINILDLAIEHCCVPAVDFLLNKGFSSESWNLSEARNIEIAQYMLHQGLTLDKAEQENDLPLVNAAKEGRTDVFKFFIESGGLILLKSQGQKALEKAQENLNYIDTAFPVSYIHTKANLSKIIQFLNQKL